MKNILFWLMAVSLVLLSATGAMAGSIVINDNPLNGPYTDLQQWTTGASPGYHGNAVWQDVEGNEFATDRMVVNLNPLTIQIYTNNRPGGVTIPGVYVDNNSSKPLFNFGVADIAIDAGPGTAGYDGFTAGFFPGQTSKYELAILTRAYANNVNGGAASLVNVSTWTSSLAEVNALTRGNYGGGWVPSPQTGKTIATSNHPVEVFASDYSSPPILTGTLSWIVNDPYFNNNDNIPDYLITIAFNGGWPAATPFDLLWGTSLCANDVVAGQVPLPGTLMLLGSGLMGLVCLRWRRRATAKN